MKVGNLKSERHSDDMNIVTPLGRFLRKFRTDRNMRMKDMAKDLNVTSAYLSSIERGKLNFTFKMIDKIISTYNLEGEIVNQLYWLATYSVKFVKIDLTELSIEDRELVILFARRYKHLSDKDKKELKAYEKYYEVENYKVSSYYF